MRRASRRRRACAWRRCSSAAAARIRGGMRRRCWRGCAPATCRRAGGRARRSSSRPRHSAVEVGARAGQALRRGVRGARRGCLRISYGHRRVGGTDRLAVRAAPRLGIRSGARATAGAGVGALPRARGASRRSGAARGRRGDQAAAAALCDLRRRSLHDSCLHRQTATVMPAKAGIQAGR